MKRVIIIAAFLWLLLVIVSYRLTAQDSLRTTVISTKGQLLNFYVNTYKDTATINGAWLQDVIKVNGVFYLKVAAFMDYEIKTFYMVLTPAPANLSLRRRNSAYVFDLPVF